jgi:hypothetical protein
VWAALTGSELIDAVCKRANSTFDVRVGNVLLATAAIARPRLCNELIDTEMKAEDLEGSVCLALPHPPHSRREMSSVEARPEPILASSPLIHSVVNMHELKARLEAAASGSRVALQLAAGVRYDLVTPPASSQCDRRLICPSPCMCVQDGEPLRICRGMWVSLHGDGSTLDAGGLSRVVEVLNGRLVLRGVHLEGGRSESRPRVAC